MFELAERKGDEIALTDPSGHLTWAEVAVKVNAAAHALLEIGFDQGRLAVLGSNCSATAIVYAAALVAGVGSILVNYQSTAEEVEYLSLDGGARAIWSSPDCLSNAREAADRLGIPLLSDGEPQWWTSLISRPRTDPPPLTGSATTDLIYTSGTTGRPKGVEVPSTPASTVRDRLAVVAAPSHERARTTSGLGPSLPCRPARCRRASSHRKPGDSRWTIRGGRRTRRH